MLSFGVLGTKWLISKGILARPNNFRSYELVARGANPIWRVSKGMLDKKKVET